MMAAGNELLAAAQDTGALRRDVRCYDVISLASAIAWAAERRAEKALACFGDELDTGLLLDVVLRGLYVAEPAWPIGRSGDPLEAPARGPVRTVVASRWWVDALVQVPLAPRR